MHYCYYLCVQKNTHLFKISCLLSKNGSELLIQMTNLFSAQQSELLSNYNSFQLFQRLLGT